MVDNIIYKSSTYKKLEQCRIRAVKPLQDDHGICEADRTVGVFSKLCSSPEECVQKRRT